MECFKQNYHRLPDKACTDSGYGSEENYQYIENNQVQAYVRYNYFHKKQTKSFKNNAFLQENLYPNKVKDCFVCPMGQHMERAYNTTRKSASGFTSDSPVYSAKNCQKCPLGYLCHHSKDNRQISVNHTLIEYKRKARERHTSEEGIRMRKKRPIEREELFGQMKYNKDYHQFRHVGKDKIAMDFAISAMVFNLL